MNTKQDSDHEVLGNLPPNHTAGFGSPGIDTDKETFWYAVKTEVPDVGVVVLVAGAIVTNSKRTIEAVKDAAVKKMKDDCGADICSCDIDQLRTISKELSRQWIYEKGFCGIASTINAVSTKAFHMNTCFSSYKADAINSGKLDGDRRGDHKWHCDVAFAFVEQ